MYPNPADVLPLPFSPSLEQYRKQAKDLVKACRSDHPDSLQAWTTEWIETLIRLQSTAIPPDRRAWFDRQAKQVAEFARNKLVNVQPGKPKCALADAQF